MFHFTIKGNIWFTDQGFLTGFNTVIEQIYWEPLENNKEKIKTKDFLIATLKQKSQGRIGNWNKLCRILKYCQKILK